MAAPLGSRLQSMLQAAVQSVQWTYTLFWQLCPQQVTLVWGDGYYNGAIKTRKTVQPMEVSAEEASLQRSQQLRELYDSLSAGETNPPTRRPCAALSPEDLTESEWFYLMCVSFSFPPGVGLPGKAYARRQHIWLTGANEVDSKTFSRAILAKSARIQTVVCIPLLDGVVEFGTTDKVYEDLNFIQHVKSFFIDHHHFHHPPLPKPALSEHSTSNPTSSSDHLTYTVADPQPVNLSSTNQDNMDEDDEEEDNEEDEAESDSGDHETGHDTHLASTPDASSMAVALAEPSELMQLEMSEDIRVGSPNDGSNNLDSNFHLLAVTEPDNPSGQADSYHVDPTQPWGPIQDHLGSLQVQLPASVLPQLEEQLTQEDTHYSQTVSTILHNQSTRWSDSPPSVACYAASSFLSAFAKWSPRDHHQTATATADGSSQWVLKYILFTVPYLHSTNNKNHDENNNNNNNSPAAGNTDHRMRGKGSNSGGGTPQDELSANHVLAERRRREKLNERFIILRSLVPFVTKMDKASILGDTIEYLKQLRRKIQDLESRNRQIESQQQQQQQTRKVRIVEGTVKEVTAVTTDKAVTEDDVASVQVSIIESDALLELECGHREGLLLDVMMVLREMRIEVIGVRSSISSDGVFVAELRGKVKEESGKKKVSIVQVKRAINQVIPHGGGGGD